MLAALFWAPSTEILYIKVSGAFQLISDFHFQLSIAPPRNVDSLWFKIDTKGRVTVKAGFVWDGASGPTFDTPDSVLASCGHDVGYKAIRLGYLEAATAKPLVDRWFYEQLQKDGMWQPRAYAWYRAVQQFGISSCDPKNETKIQRAPIPFPPELPIIVSPVPGYFVQR